MSSQEPACKGYPMMASDFIVDRACSDCRDWSGYTLREHHGSTPTIDILRCIVLVPFIVVLVFSGGCKQSTSRKTVPTPNVTAVHPIQKEITTYLKYTGTTAALQTVDIRARVPGYLDTMHFKPRSKVKKGDLLFVIDPRQYQASVEESSGKLASTKARLRLSEVEVQIAQHLEGQEAISALRLKKRVAQKGVATGDVEQAEGQLAKSKLKLEWTRVTSPIDGRVSRNQVDLGNLVGANEKTLLTTVVDDSQVYVYFNVSETDLLPVLRLYGKESSEKKSDSFEKVPVYIGLADEEGYPHEGHLDFAETTVDSGTGTIQVRGKIPNPDGLFMAGMFVRVRVPTKKRMALLVPEESVQFDQGGKYVLTVDEENVVRRKRIKTGELVGQMMTIEQGLTAKDRVITLGVLQARPGSKVNPVKTPEGVSSSKAQDSGKSQKD
jgi:multidrug efflux system membrane fusion protein